MPVKASTSNTASRNEKMLWISASRLATVHLPAIEAVGVTAVGISDRADAVAGLHVGAVGAKLVPELTRAALVFLLIAFAERVHRLGQDRHLGGDGAHVQLFGFTYGDF